ncbi:MAG: sulfur-carrier protein [Pseudonocardiales bacterium]|jgi:molybdopterin converting factor small subunit|nr:sulfur-carrier protein [Pseudonocardiales bacterium]
MSGPAEDRSGQVNIRLPRMLADEAGGVRQLSLELRRDSTVGSLLAELADRYPILGRRLRDETGALRRFVNVYLDGEDVRQLAGLQTPVKVGDEVSILQSVAGG